MFNSRLHIDDLIGQQEQLQHETYYNFMISMNVSVSCLRVSISLSSAI